MANFYLEKSLCNHNAFGRGFVVFTHKAVTPCLQRADKNGGLGAWRYYFFAVQVMAFEFFGRAVLVVNNQLHALAGRHFQFYRLKAMILQD